MMGLKKFYMNIYNVRMYLSFCRVIYIVNGFCGFIEYNKLF